MCCVLRAILLSSNRDRQYVMVGKAEIPAAPSDGLALFEGRSVKDLQEMAHERDSQAEGKRWS